MIDKAWLFLMGLIAVLFVPLLIGGVTQRIEPILVSFVGTPIMLFFGIRYERQINGSVNHD